MHLHDDPYTWAMARIVPSITKALTHQGGMSDEEMKTLLAVRDVIASRDANALAMNAKAVIVRQ